jgi:single-stranded DNA-binding protein
MSDWNEFAALGAIVSEPEMRETKNGKPFARFRFGYNRGWGDNKQQCYLTVLCWGKLGESICEWGTVGRKYLLVGDLSVIDSKGDNGYSTSVFVNAATMKPLTFEENGNSNKGSKKSTGDPVEAAYGSGDDDDDEDIPF